MPVFTTSAFFDGPGRIVLCDVELPDPDVGEVLIEVAACGICGSDLHQLTGRWPQPTYALGHELAGTVVALGSEVTAAAVGDRVCVEPFIYCGHCRYCMSGRYFQCPEMGFLTLTADGAFSRYMLTPAYSLYKLPDSVSFEVGALAEPLAVGIHAARLSGVGAADTVLVLGAGAIGLMCVAAARHMGARRVLVTGRHAHQAQAALALGADAVLSTDTDELKQQLGGELPDVVLEAVGSEARTLQQAIDVAAPLGRIALMGGNTAPMDGIDFSRVIMKELTLFGSGCYSQFGTCRDFSLAVDALAAKPAVFESLITHRYPLASICEAFETAQDKARSRAIKVMITG